jgi:hypothetical protein
MIITDSVTPPDESCEDMVVETTGTFSPPPGAKVWTRAGVNDAENLFWGRRSAVWNNTGDKAVLRDENGVDVARYAY